LALAESIHSSGTLFRSSRWAWSWPIIRGWAMPVEKPIDKRIIKTRGKIREFIGQVLMKIRG
jgi:hypothetical protein